MKAFLCVLLIGFVSVQGWEISTEEGVQATLQVDRTELTTDETVRLQFSLTLPSDFMVDWEPISSEFERWIDARGIEIRANRRLPKADGIVVEYLLRFWEPGKRGILFPKIPVEGPGNIFLEPDLIVIEVRLPSTPSLSSPGGAAPLLPLHAEGLQQLSEENRQQLIEASAEQQAREAEEALRRRSLPWKVLMVALALGLLGYGAYRLLPQLLERKAPPPEPVDPHRKAQEALDDLESANLPQQKAWKPFYHRLTGIVRTFMEDKFQLRAPEQTTEEFLQDLTIASELPEKVKVGLREFLYTADLVKFAKAEPTEEECNQALQGAREMTARGERKDLKRKGPK